MFEYRIEGRDFQPVLKKWWEGQDFVVLTEELLPNRIFVASLNGVDFYAIPVYATDSAFAWMGFPTANPEIKQEDKELKSSCFVYLLEQLETCLKRDGFSRIITTSMHNSVMNNLEKRDFLKVDEGTNFFIKIV
jgi:hypothetical protein